MAIEVAQYISQLNPSNPSGFDPIADADNHLRLIKQALRNTFPNLDGPITAKASAFAGLCPIGTVVAFGLPLDQVPAGWAYCDGSSFERSDGGGTITTPDLRDRYVVGTSPSKGLNAAVGAATQSVTTSLAGGHSHTGETGFAGLHNHGRTGNTALTVDQMPPHGHEYATLTLTNGQQGSGLYSPSLQLIANGTGTTAAVGSGAGHSHDTANSGEHKHPVTVGNAGEHTHTAAVTMAPLSRALHYIMKI